MEKKEKISHFSKKKREVLDDLIEKGADEMGLLDLVFIEEMLNQNEREKAG